MKFRKAKDFRVLKHVDVLGDELRVSVDGGNVFIDTRRSNGNYRDDAVMLRRHEAITLAALILLELTL